MSLKETVDRVPGSFRGCERWEHDGSLTSWVIWVSFQTSVVPKFSSQKTNCRMRFFSSQLQYFLLRIREGLQPRCPSKQLP